MDVLYRHSGIDFVWDAHKAAENVSKHGIRFERACEVFFDPLARALDAGNKEDARDALVGETEAGALLFVVHLERLGGVIRMISARHATFAERKTYEDDE